MPEVAAFRADLLASRRAGRVRAMAQALTAAAAAACMLALLLAPSPLRLAATLGSVGVLVLAFCPGRRSVSRQLAVGSDGAIRACSGDADEAAGVRYFSPHFVCLRAPRGPLLVWPDSLAATDWRRLLVACRWQHRREGEDSGAQRGPRTK